MSFFVCVISTKLMIHSCSVSIKTGSVVVNVNLLLSHCKIIWRWCIYCLFFWIFIRELICFILTVFKFMMVLRHTILHICWQNILQFFSHLLLFTVIYLIFCLQSQCIGFKFQVGEKLGPVLFRFNCFIIYLFILIEDILL